uniref:Serine and arginine rich splicing factor 7a n=1 Tax=Fundulus heteroclitus TaxID=8078 RepID=A0A3Q2SZ23_FUNHE
EVAVDRHAGVSSRATDCKVYVGDLGNGAAKGELERAFSYYGPLRTVWVARNPPGFAFVEFEDPRDAEDAVKGMDGKILCGSRVRVEMSTGMSRKGRGRPSRRQFDPNDRCYQCGDRGHYAYDCYRYSKRGRRKRFQHLSFLFSSKSDVDFCPGINNLITAILMTRIIKMSIFTNLRQKQKFCQD